MGDVRADLVSDGQVYGRAKRASERARTKLGETIRRAAAGGIGPAEITRLINHHLTERTVFRIIQGKD